MSERVSAGGPGTFNAFTRVQACASLLYRDGRTCDCGLRVCGCTRAASAACMCKHTEPGQECYLHPRQSTLQRRLCPGKHMLCTIQCRVSGPDTLAEHFASHKRHTKSQHFRRTTHNKLKPCACDFYDVRPKACIQQNTSTHAQFTRRPTDLRGGLGRAAWDGIEKSIPRLWVLRGEGGTLAASYELTDPDCEAYRSCTPPPSRGRWVSLKLSRNFPWSHHLCHFIHLTTFNIFCHI